MFIRERALLNMAGPGGFEPPHDGIKTRCLTAWRRPNELCCYILPKPGRIIRRVLRLTPSGPAGKHRCLNLFPTNLSNHPHDGIKTRCLTAWRRPNELCCYILPKPERIIRRVLRLTPLGPAEKHRCLNLFPTNLSNLRMTGSVIHLLAIASW